MLIKLTAVPCPDVLGGQEYPVYVDHEKIFLITIALHRMVSEKDTEANFNLALSLFEQARNLEEKLRNFKCDLQDPVSVTFLRDAHQAANAVSSAYKDFSLVAKEPLRYGPVQCTQVQISSGPDGQGKHSNIFVIETPDVVARMVTDADRFKILPRY